MKKKTLILLIGLLCIALLLVFVTVATLRKKNTSGNEPSDFQTQQTNPSVETETQAQENPMETTSVPNQQETGSTQSTTESTQPTTGSSQPTTGSSQPTTGSSQPTTGATQPTTGASQPTTEPSQPATGTTQPATNPTNPKVNSKEPTVDPTVPPEEAPPFVEILPGTDPDTGEEEDISFPCQIPGYDLVVEKIAPYSGMFVEDGSNATVQNVAMLMVRNDGQTAIEYTQIRMVYNQEELLFDITALPAGEKLVVQEKNGKAITEGSATSATALIVQRADMEISEDKVRVVDNGDNTLTIQNLTDQVIPTVRVFYKYYMQEEELYVGGIAFTVRLSRLGAGASISIRPSHYTSQTSRVVMVLTYDSEV